VAKVRTDVMKEQLATFRSQLEEFARKHKVINCSCTLLECRRRRKKTVSHKVCKLYRSCLHVLSVELLCTLKLSIRHWKGEGGT